MIDIAARQFGYDRIDLRRRNLIPPKAQPYANPLGMTYDCGDYAKVMDRALALSDWKGFDKRKRESKTQQEAARHRACQLSRDHQRRAARMVEGRREAGGPRRSRRSARCRAARATRRASRNASANGSASMSTAIKLIQGDTDIVPVGGGSHSARSMRMGGVVMGKASEAVIQKATKIAGHVLETDPADVAFAEGRFTVKGTDRSIGLFEVARAARERNDLPEDLRGPLAAECDEMIRGAGFPFGCAVCEVEIDPDTGHVEIVRYTAIDDVGRAINPLILHGQTHGGIVQGVGQALWEHSHYDPRERAVAGRLDDGLRHAARPHAAVVRHRAERDAGAGQSARRARRRRRRHHAGARRGGQRRGRCAIGLRRDAYRDAGDGGEGLARDPETRKAKAA